MKKRTIIGMAATALACGMMAVALCPGTALASYCPDTLSAEVMSSAQSVTLGKSVTASVTCANETATNNAANSKGNTYCTDTNIIKVYKFTPTETADYLFSLKADKSMQLCLYELSSDGTTSLVTWEASGGSTSITQSLEAKTTYYFVASAYWPNYNWSGTVTLGKAKAAVDGSVSALGTYYGHYIMLKYTFVYGDGTSYATIRFGSNSAKDKYGNHFASPQLLQTELTSNYSNSTPGSYYLSSKLYAYNNTSAQIRTAVFKLTLGTAKAAVASATPITTSKALASGVYVATAQRAGEYYFAGKWLAAFKYNAAENALIPVAYISDEEPDAPNSVKVAKGDKLYIITSAEDGASSMSFYTANLSGTKLTQVVKVKKATAVYKATVLKKAAKSFAIGASAKTACTYKVISGAKWVTVSKAGKVTVKKGAKKGTYKVKVTAKATANYLAASKVVTITIK